MADLLDLLAAEIRAHRGSGCGFEPCASCTQMVPGSGPADAAVMVVGEAPGAKEDAAGKPFVGPSGRLLDELLAEAGLSRESVFITNVFKARPPGNRDPNAAEVAHHRPWLERQIELIDPALIVPLGRHALKHVAPGRPIGDVHGTRIDHDGRAIFPLYHPAAALHNPRLRPVLTADAQALGRALRTIGPA